MPLSTLLSLIDEIAVMLDDVAALTKVAARKTTGVLGDDLALNAQQVSGVRADQELPVVWAVAKGSAVNKAILVPAALAISAVAPGLVPPLLMIGGLYLCFEGVEKIAHSLQRRIAARRPSPSHPASPPRAVSEKDRIRGAIRTDFVLSAEIVVITLGTVTDAVLATRVLVLVGVSALMTVGVYGCVAIIVKLDDAGLWLSARPGPGAGPRLGRAMGWGILRTAPFLMRVLGIAGTVAMFLVGGGILVHAVPATHVVVDLLDKAASAVPVAGSLMRGAVPQVADAVVGIVAGVAAVLVVTGARRIVARVRGRR